MWGSTGIHVWTPQILTYMLLTASFKVFIITIFIFIAEAENQILNKHWFHYFSFGIFSGPWNEEYQGSTESLWSIMIHSLGKINLSSKPLKSNINYFFNPVAQKQNKSRNLIHNNFFTRRYSTIKSINQMNWISRFIFSAPGLFYRLLSDQSGSSLLDG